MVLSDNYQTKKIYYLIKSQAKVSFKKQKPVIDTGTRSTNQEPVSQSEPVN